MSDAKILIERLSAGFGDKRVLHDVSLTIGEGQVLALLGPSGCGKSTLLRCLNRMHETVHGAYVTGEVSIDGVDIYGTDIEPADLRRRVGMVFQRPNPFPHMTIAENVLAGFRLVGDRREDADEILERALRQAALWDEVKDRLHAAGASLSGGQQQRLCIARALAIEPDVLLMDEPCSALDPASTARVEDLIHELCGTFTIVIVTHNLAQARRVGTDVAFLLDGRLVEAGTSSAVFEEPRDPRTRDYVQGRYG